MRAALIALGAAVVGYGGWLLLATQDLTQVAGVALWAAVAVAVHDLLLVPVVLALGALVGRDGGDRRTRTAVVVLVLLGPVSLAAAPAFVGLGADPGMPTLLGRDYLFGWGVLACGTVVTGVVLAWSRIVSGQERGRSAGGTDPRGR